MKKVYLALAASLLLAPQFSMAASNYLCRAFYGGTVLKLSEFEGRPFFDTMKTVRLHMDNASVTSFVIPNSKQVLEKAKEFHPDAYYKILRLLLSREEGFLVRKNEEIKSKAEAKLAQLVDAIAGKPVLTIPMNEIDPSDKTPHVVNVIARAMKDLKIGGNILAAMNIATFLSIASGEGSKVVINDKNYFVNVGYELDNMDRAEKSGRSSSTSPFSGFNDASDTFLLTSLHKMIAENKSRSSSHFYEAMMQLLVKSSPRAYEKLTDEEQGNLTDFIAVYSAEMRRSMMSDLKKHRWMDDLAEVYFVSGYGSKAGKVIGTNGFADGEAKTYFAVGADGSGIGVMRKYRRYLQSQITSAVRDLKPELVSNIESIIGPISSRSDVFHDVMIFLNDSRKQDDVQRQGDQLISAVNKLMVFIEDNHAQITPYLEHITKDDPEIKKYNAELERKRKAREAKQNGQR